MVGRDHTAEASLFLHDLSDRGIAVYLDTFAPKLLFQFRRHDVIHGSHQVLLLFHNGHAGAEIAEHGCKFHCDHASAHNGQAVKIPVFRCQKPVAVPHSRQACPRYVVHHGDGSCCYYDCISLKKFASAFRQFYLHGPVPAQGGCPVYDLHFLPVKSGLYAFAVFCHGLLFVFLHLSEIKGNKVR